MRVAVSNLYISCIYRVRGHLCTCYILGIDTHGTVCCSPSIENRHNNHWINFKPKKIQWKMANNYMIQLWSICSHHFFLFNQNSKATSDFYRSISSELSTPFFSSFTINQCAFLSPVEGEQQTRLCVKVVPLTDTDVGSLWLFWGLFLFDFPSFLLFFF